MTSSQTSVSVESAYDDSVVSQIGREPFLNLLVDNASNGLIAIDPSSTVVYANPAIKQIFGYEPQELVGEPLTVLIPERLKQLHLDAVNRYLKTGERGLDWNGVELSGLHREGYEIPLEIAFQEVKQNGQHIFIGIINDVTERQRAENERRLLYSVSRAVAEAESGEDGLGAAIQQVCNLTNWVYGEAWVPADDGSYLVRVPSAYADPDGYESFRATASQETFEPGEGLPGRVWQTGDSEWVPDIAGGADTGFNRARAAADVGFHSALGVPIVNEGNVVSVLVFCTDETRSPDNQMIGTLETLGSELGQLVARRRAEARLEQEREILQRVLDTSPVGIYTVGHDGEPIRMNARAEELLGVSQSVITGRPYRSSELICFDGEGEPIAPDEHPVAQVLMSGQPVHDFEHQVELPDGTRRWLSMNAVPIHEATGDLSRVIVTLADITESKEYELELERRRTELRTELDEILDRISDAMFALDADWRFTFVNDRAQELLGHSEADLLEESIWEVFEEATETTFQAEYERAMETQEAVSFEEYYEPLETWFQVNAYPSESGLSVYFDDITERKRYEHSLTALHAAARDMVRSTDEQTLGELVVETATALLEQTGAAMYLFDGDDGLLRPAACSDNLRASLTELPPIRPGEGIAGRVFINDSAARFDDVRRSDHVYNPETPIRSEIILPLGDRGVLLAASTEAGVYDERSQEILELLAATTEATLGRLEREQNLRDREQELATQNRQLTRLDRINELIRDVHGVLVDATTRQEIDEAVCKRLVEFDPISFVWIAESDTADNSLSPRAWAGDDQGYLEAVIGDVRRNDDYLEPSFRTVNTNDVTVIESVAEGIRTESWRQAALARGFQSVISVPLRFDEFSYGTLTVFASETEFFDEMTQDVFAELGRDIANSINAVETKQGLLFDRVVQIEVRIEEADDILHRLAAELGETVEFQGHVPREEKSLVYFSAGNADPSLVESFTTEQVAFNHVRHLGDYDGDSLFEAVVNDSLVASEIVNLGGIPQSIQTDGDELRAIIDLPHQRDVRSFIERLRTHCPDAELVARRETERSIETRQGFEDELRDRLTDRQLEVLRTAYYAGFYDQPRTSTGEEIGQALGITQPTVNAHLRAAQRRLLGMLFGDRSGLH